MVRAPRWFSARSWVGILDGLDAVLFFYLRSGVPPLRILQSIAKWAPYFFIASVIVLTYFAAARRAATLAHHPVPWGLVYGLLYTARWHM